MSRDKRISRQLYDRLVARASERGYPVEKLVIMSPLY
jgi:lipocalin